MATFSSRDIQLLMIGQAANKTTAGPETMNDGEIGIFTPSGTRLTEATAVTAEKFVIIKKTPGGVPLVSGVINKADLSSIDRGLYDAATVQVSTIGYNGISGSIDAINDNDYYVRWDFIQGYVSNHAGLYKRNAFYRSDISATEFEIASNLLENCVAEFSKAADKLLLTEMLSDEAGAAIGGAETITANYGSKWVASSGVAHGVVAGNLLRIGVALTDACYVVKSVSGANIELTTRYQGANVIASAAEVITALVGSFGIRFTAIEPPHVVSKLHADLNPVSFNVRLENFGTTTAALVTAGSRGNGTEKQVQELEWFTQGNEGYIYRVGEPGIFPSRAEAIGNYNILNIVIKELHKDSIAVKPMNKLYTLALPIPTPNYAITGTADDITDVLEVLLTGATDGSLTL